MKSMPMKYALSVISMAAALWIRWLFDSVFEDRFVFVIPSLAFVFAVWYCGRGPSIVSLLFGLAASSYLFLTPRHSLLVRGADNLVGVITNLVTGLAIILLTETLRAAQRRAEQHAATAIAKQNQLKQEIDERRRAEESRHENEERYRAIFNQANIGIVEADLQGCLQLVNDKFCEIVGYLREELIGHGFQEFTHPDDLAACLALFERATKDQMSFAAEKRYVRADGSIVWANTSVGIVTDRSGKPVYAVGVIQDITDRKRAEDQVQAEQVLLKQLYESLENERKLVAYELHDGPIQYETTAQMHLKSYLEVLPEKPAELELTLKLLGQAISESRRLMYGLRPPVLDEAGLVGAIEHLIGQQAGEGPTIEFVHEGSFPEPLAPSLESVIYRIVQEALTNARKYSGSQRVCVTLRRRDGLLRLEIQDWGVGFTPDAGAPHPGGLQGFARRVRLAGGELKIESSRGEGTRIIVELPELHAMRESTGP